MYLAFILFVFVIYMMIEWMLQKKEDFGVVELMYELNPNYELSEKTFYLN